MLQQPKQAIDLSRYQFVREIGDLAIYGTWLWNEDQEDTEPCLVVVPRYRRIGYKPVVVALSAAFRYNNPKYLAHVAGIFAESLGFSNDMTNARKIATLIHDHLLDLLTMPIDPTDAKVVGEASVDIGGRRRTVEILDYEQQKA